MTGRYHRTTAITRSRALLMYCPSMGSPTLEDNYKQAALLWQAEEQAQAAIRSQQSNTPKTIL